MKPQLIGIFVIMFILTFNGSYAHSQEVITKAFGKGIHVLTPKYTVDFDLYWKNSMWRVGANVK